MEHCSNHSRIQQALYLWHPLPTSHPQKDHPQEDHPQDQKRKKKIIWATLTCNLRICRWSLWGTSTDGHKTNEELVAAAKGCHIALAQVGVEQKQTLVLCQIMLATYDVAQQELTNSNIFSKPVFSSTTSCKNQKTTNHNQNHKNNKRAWIANLPTYQNGYRVYSSFNY